MQMYISWEDNKIIVEYFNNFFINNNVTITCTHNILTKHYLQISIYINKKLIEQHYNFVH